MTELNSRRSMPARHGIAEENLHMQGQDFKWTAAIGYIMAELPLKSVYRTYTNCQKLMIAVQEYFFGDFCFPELQHLSAE